jgi:hypothetical protein
LFRSLCTRKKRLTLIRLGTKSFAAYAGSRLISGRRRAALSSLLRYVLTSQMCYQSELEIVTVDLCVLAYSRPLCERRCSFLLRQTCIRIRRTCHKPALVLSIRLRMPAFSEEQWWAASAPRCMLDLSAIVSCSVHIDVICRLSGLP